MEYRKPGTNMLEGLAGCPVRGQSFLEIFIVEQEKQKEKCCSPAPITVGVLKLHGPHYGSTQEIRSQQSALASVSGLQDLPVTAGS